ncbi:hypothetical protein SK128_006980, partial [Halocaridina rubra]
MSNVSMGWASECVAGAPPTPLPVRSRRLIVSKMHRFNRYLTPRRVLEKEAISPLRSREITVCIGFTVGWRDRQLYEEQ